VERLVLVTSALGLDGGGAALLSRLTAQVAADYCSEHNITFKILNLGLPTDVLPHLQAEHFSQSQRALALAVWREVLAPQKTAFIFDHVGPARTMGVLPGFVRPRYLTWMLGVELWRPFMVDRRRALSKATILLAISEYTIRRTRQHHPWLRTDIPVVHLTLENRPIQGKIDTHLISQLDDPYALIVGRLDTSQRHKGHDDLLQIWPDVLKECPAAKLVIAGKGDDLPRLQSIARDNQIHNSVIFTGFVSEATREWLYQNCRVFVMPSRNEGFGLVFLEAMKEARPCIALRDSSVAEIVTEETGMLVDTGNLEQLREAVIHFFDNQENAAIKGQAGYQRWQTHFTFRTFESNLRPHLDQLIGP
jgi:phosphatidyl-myo-inositol dimannoside synthase